MPIFCTKAFAKLNPARFIGWRGMGYEPRLFPKSIGTILHLGRSRPKVAKENPLSHQRMSHIPLFRRWQARGPETRPLRLIGPAVSHTNIASYTKCLGGMLLLSNAAIITGIKPSHACRGPRTEKNLLSSVFCLLSNQGC